MLSLTLAGAVFAQEPRPQGPVPVEPPEEDASYLPKEYAFNPIQAEKEMTVGAFYFKKGNYRAASRRFEEATKWNPGLAAAYLRLGEAQDRMKEKDAAREAYAKFLELAPDAKEAAQIRKKLGVKAKP